ncbi:hypothetical protein MKW94_015907 [Papaver nudicaule]|uniref:ADF-H domain-containing protein n=1 Tax=Papaver nudicaule TaxID=74823 RepID=A0AA42B3T2_PAPNU|nr:hypothetical protein [Papaver nudicaule]
MANTSSGFKVHDECKLRFLKLKAKRTYCFIVFKIEEKLKQVVVEKLGSKNKRIYASTKDIFKRELDSIQVELHGS